MSEPGVPNPEEDGGREEGGVELPCGERIERGDLDLGMREFGCACGETHAVVMDMHPLGRFFPEDVVDVLREAVEPSEKDEFDEFSTVHLMGAVREEFPEDVVAVDASANGDVGYAAAWVADFDARTLHEYAVELMVELMEHAVSHGTEASAQSEFEAQMVEFDAAAFVEEYRAERDWDADRVGPR